MESRLRIVWIIKEGFILKRKQRSSLHIGGKNCFKSLPPGRFENRMFCTRTSWRRGCKSAYSSTCPGAKCLARQGIEAILHPKKQRQPLPSLLYKSVIYDSLLGSGYRIWNLSELVICCCPAEGQPWDMIILTLIFFLSEKRY